MSAISIVPSATLVPLFRHQLPARGQLPAQCIPAVLQPTPTGTTCVWCGQPIYDLDVIQHIGLAELHSLCAQQFDIYAYGDVVSADQEGTR